MAQRIAKKVVLIGWDAADWQVITPLLDQGLMPALQGLIERGVMGNLSTLRPVLSPSLWNSIATGKRAYKHGIMGFVEPRADGTGIRTVSSTSRKCKALWNILSQRGLKSNVVSWYASYPAEPINGVYVSDQFNNVKIPDGGKTPPQEFDPKWVHPQSIAPRLAELRVHRDAIGPHHIGPFVPRLGEIPNEKAGTLNAIRKMLARCATVNAVATELLEYEPADFSAFYFETIDHFCHGFMPYHPPRQDHVPEESFEWYKSVVNGIYRFHDMMLERQLQLAGPDATIVLMSDHGFLNDHLRPIEPPDKCPKPEAWHRSHGIIVMAGPGILKDERIYGASLLDVAPTILTMLGLPVGRDMDGKVLLQAFDQPVEVEWIDSWDTLNEGDPGLHPTDLRVDPFEQQEALKQLIELGYIQDPGKDGGKAIKRVTIDAKFNRGVSLFEAGRIQDALEQFEALMKSEAEDEEVQPRMAVAVAQCYLALGRVEEAKQLLQQTPRKNPNHAAHSKAMLGSIELMQGNTEQAMEMLRGAEEADPRFPTLHLQIGNMYLRSERWEDAARAFARAMEIDPDNAEAHYGIGVSQFNRRMYREAAESLLKAVGLFHHMPRAHYALGLALLKLEMFEQAARSIEVSMSFGTPDIPLISAHRYLTAIYRRLGKPEIAMEHRRVTQDLISRRRRKPAAAT